MEPFVEGAREEEIKYDKNEIPLINHWKKDSKTFSSIYLINMRCVSTNGLRTFPMEKATSINYIFSGTFRFTKPRGN